MTHNFAIHPFDQGVYLLDVVVTPVDDFTGLPILRGVTATIPAQAAKAQRGLSGNLIFERLVAKPQYIVRLDPSRAGYFTPPDFPVDMPQDRDARIVRLIRRPDAIRDGEAMLVRGSVSHAGVPVQGQLVEGRIADIADPFRTQTDERGNFALRLRPPSPDLNADPRPVPLIADVVLRLPGVDGVPAILLDEVKDLQTWAPPVNVVIP